MTHNNAFLRRLNDLDLFGRSAANKPLTSVKNCKRHLKFAYDHFNWTTDQWKKVLWSDDRSLICFEPMKIYILPT